MKTQNEIRADLTQRIVDALEAGRHPVAQAVAVDP